MKGLNWFNKFKILRFKIVLNKIKISQKNLSQEIEKSEDQLKHDNIIYLLKNIFFVIIERWPKLFLFFLKEVVGRLN